MSVFRGVEISGSHAPLPSEAIAIANIIFTLSGFVNVCLYAFTRPGLFPAHWKGRFNLSFEESIDQVETYQGTKPGSSNSPTEGVLVELSSLKTPSQHPPMLGDDDGENTAFLKGPESTIYAGMSSHSSPQRTSLRDSSKVERDSMGEGEIAPAVQKFN
jgi:hypothetical protein